MLLYRYLVHLRKLALLRRKIVLCQCNQLGLLQCPGHVTSSGGVEYRTADALNTVASPKSRIGKPEV